ncbi:MAG: type II secretion system F family protein [Clostridiales bacterium]
MENIVLGILCFNVVIFILLYIISKNKYKKLVKPLDKKEWKLKDIYSVGLLVQDIIKYRFRFRFDRTALKHLSELYGFKFGRYHQKIHLAYRISLVSIVLIFDPFILYFSGVDKNNIIGCFVFLILAIVIPDIELKNKVTNRKNSIKMDFPLFVNKLVLLINAGMTVSGAWKRVNKDNKSNNALYKEIRTTIAEIDGGKLEIQAYEDFSRRCGISEVNKFISVLIQNVKKGDSEIIYTLKFMAKECWELRKNTAKRLGEEASTKLLLPMMIMFIAIILIIVTPAVLQLQTF